MTNTTYRIHIIRKNNKPLTSISTAPIKDVYAMLYGAIELVAKNTNQSVGDVLSVLADLDKYTKNQNQN